ncbi:HNH endonuclease [Bacillus sp. sid0103]|uniref:HNH endonuclease n=1 Tax=Bacillus sp. sid0103 TaxID=2856337 RepID=UPI001C497C98|nr:HNH endonuclease [Bacillus sp. sid0103]MBV7509484.1 HNH endonuclease [Bacillus sp. sid0103]
MERFPFELDRSKHLYCSKDCLANDLKERMVGEKNHNWRGGHEDYRGENWNEQRLKALDRDGYLCQECGQNNLITKLAVHHKIPYRFYDGNYIRANDLKNLITLCNSCHSSQESHYWLEVPLRFRHLI